MRAVWGTTMKRCFVLISVLSLFFFGDLFASELPYLYKGPRPLGMGGAFVALSNDANALFYNPAGLADVKETRISLLDLETEVGEGAYDFYSDALDVDTDNEADVAQFLRKYMGDYAHAAVTSFPNYSRPNFAFGLIASMKSNLQVRDRQYPKLYVDAIEDAGVCAGYAKAFLDDSLLVGSSLKYVYRKSIEKQYTVPEIITHDFKDRLDDDAEDGSGVLLDIGVIYKLNDFKPNGKDVGLQVGLSANNLIGNGLGDAQDLDEHIDIGISSRIEKLTIALDYVDLFGQMGEDDNIGKRIHFGIEYTPTKTLALRTGINQGYLTLGASLMTRVVQFDVLTYAEEVGAYSGQRDNRRYLLRMGLGF